MLYALATLRELRPDIIHLNSPAGLPIVAAAKHMGVPVVLHVRNGAMAPYQDFVGWTDHYITVSDFLRKELLAFDVSAKHVTTIYDEVNPAHFNPAAFDKQRVRKELGIPADANVVLMIARITPYKRHDLMLQAAAEARKHLPRLHLLLIGEVFSQQNADLYNRIRAQAQTLGLMDMITWLEFAHDIRRLHAAADALVLCSDREGLGRCVVEAMAMQVPIVVTDSGGSHELVGDDQRGYRVRAGDAADLATKLALALTDTVGTQRMVAEAHDYACTHLNARVAAQQVTRVYERILSDSGNSNDSWMDLPITGNARLFRSNHV
jgi:glycosyltransferase involved in cell wall biosynthesis